MSRTLARVLGESYVAADHPFINRTLSKKEMSDFISDLVDHYGATAISELVLFPVKLGGSVVCTCSGSRLPRSPSHL